MIATTGAAAALAFLHLNGVDISRLSSDEVYEMMMATAKKEMRKEDLSDFLRCRLS